MSSPALEAVGLSCGYGGRAVVHDISFAVAPGEILAVLGPNGAGKTTLLRTLAGALRPVSGAVRVDGAAGARRLHRRARQGVGYVSEERSVFMDLTLLENLRIGDGDPELALELFPELVEHVHRKAGLLSGGQQQILSLARALVAQPRVLLADELSLGLAPLVVERLLTAVREAADNTKVAVVLVEQHARQALRVADHVISLQRGEIVMEGTGSEMLGRLGELESSYLGG